MSDDYTDDLPQPEYDDGGLSGDLPRFSGRGTGRKVEDQRQVGFGLNPGKYHAELIDLTQQKSAQHDPEGQIVLLAKFTCYKGVLANGKTWDGPERTQTVFLRYLENDGSPSIQCAILAYALGMIEKNQIEAQDEEFEIDWKEAIGRQCVLEVVPKIKDKTQFTVYRGFFRFEDNEAQGVPLDEAMLTQAGYKVPVKKKTTAAARPAQRPAARPAATTPPQRPSAPPKRGGLRGL